MAKERSIQIYPCGGAGLNIGAKLNTDGNDKFSSGTSIKVAYIDTSPANTRRLGPDDFFYRIPGIEGSGQKRDEYPAEIMAHIPNILQQAKSGDLNLVIFSAGGGSGSVAGPLLARELMRRGELVLCIVVGAHSTRNWLKNTLGTLRTLEKFALNQNKALPIVYLENGIHGNDDDVDNTIVGIVAGLTMLWSGENDELDIEDLSNFFNYDRVTSFEPGVVTLHIEDAISGPAVEDGQIVSVASLARDRSTAIYTNGVIEYQTIGLLPEHALESVVSLVPMHFVLVDGLIQQHIERLAAKKEEHDSIAGARQSRKTILRHEDQKDDDDLIF